MVERKLWARLRNAQMAGASFRRQHPVGPFVLDFYCPSAKLGVELDGGQHAERIGYDAVRTRFLEAKGIRILRFWNHDVVGNMDGVLESVWREVTQRRGTQTPTRGAARPDLPLAGGGE